MRGGYSFLIEDISHFDLGISRRYVDWVLVTFLWISSRYVG